jgi:hypothetical protein
MIPEIKQAESRMALPAGIVQSVPGSDVVNFANE